MQPLLYWTTTKFLQRKMCLSCKKTTKNQCTHREDRNRWSCRRGKHAALQRGWEGGWQLWTSESCSVRISAPSLQQARCRMKGGIAWVSTLQGKQEILLRIYAVPAKSLPHLKQKQPAFSLSWLCSCWQRAALQSRPVPALYGEIQHQEMG